MCYAPFTSRNLLNLFKKATSTENFTEFLNGFLCCGRVHYGHLGPFTMSIHCHQEHPLFQWASAAMVPLANPMDGEGLVMACSKLSDIMDMFSLPPQFAHRVQATRSSFWQILSCGPYHSGLHVAAVVAFSATLVE